MPNPIKFDNSFTNPRGHSYINNKNFYIGLSGDFGPTSQTGYYAGITPPAEGYTLYTSKSAQGPSIMVFSNSSSLSNELSRRFGNTFEFTNAGIVSASEANDICVLNRDVRAIPTSTLTQYWEPNLVMSSVSGSSKVFSLNSNYSGSMISRSLAGDQEGFLWSKVGGNDKSFFWEFTPETSTRGEGIVTNVTGNNDFQNFTIVMWFKVGTTTVNNPQTLLDKSGGSLALHQGITIDLEKATVPPFGEVWTPSVTLNGENLKFTPTLSNGAYFGGGTWYCCSFSFAGKGYTFQRLGGSFTPFTSSFSGGGGASTSQPLAIGRKSLGSQCFSGSIMSIGLYTGSKDGYGFASDFYNTTHTYFNSN